jgi:putative transcriptional regulator
VRHRRSVILKTNSYYPVTVESLRGQLLIAAPSLLDPSFRRAVVLVAQHSEAGAMGLVLNRRSEAGVAEAVPPLAGLVDEDEQVWTGGPVEPGGVIVLAEFEAPEDSAELIFGRVGFMGAEADPLQVAIATRRARVYAGYAGWDAAQLEAELESDSWYVAPALPEDVFNDSPDLWSDVLARKGGAYGLLSKMPPDPSLN